MYLFLIDISIKSLYRKSIKANESKATYVVLASSWNLKWLLCASSINYDYL